MLNIFTVIKDSRYGSIPGLSQQLDAHGYLKLMKPIILERFK